MCTGSVKSTYSTRSWSLESQCCSVDLFTEDEWSISPKLTPRSCTSCKPSEKFTPSCHILYIRCTSLGRFIGSRCVFIVLSPSSASVSDLSTTSGWTEQWSSDRVVADTLVATKQTHTTMSVLWLCWERLKLCWGQSVTVPTKVSGRCRSANKKLLAGRKIKTEFYQTLMWTILFCCNFPPKYTHIYA